MSKSDFEKADAEANTMSTKVVSSEFSSSLEAAPADMMELRQQLVSKYHEGNKSLVDRLNQQGKNNLEELVMALVDEVIKETDSLLGNELVATRAGNLRDATIISFKRSEVIEKAIKALQTKQSVEKGQGVDVNSPAMRIVFQYFMNKVKHVFDTLGYDDEASDVFFRTLAGVTDGWKKELSEEIASMKVLNT